MQYALIFVEYLKDIAQVSCWLAGPLLAYFAWRALEQIKGSKRIAEIKAERDALAITCERCQFYADTVVPLTGTVAELFKTGKLKEFSAVKVDESNEKSFKLEFQTQGKWLEELEDNRHDIMTLMNSLEAFALPFSTGLADEKTAFSPVSHSFCNTVKSLLTAIMYNYIQAGTFVHTMSLYITWRDRRERDRIQQQQKNIEHQQKEIEKKLASIKVQTITPIGTAPDKKQKRKKPPVL